MFRRRILFIVGAGASSEFGLPVGIGLAQSISELLKAQRDENRFIFADENLLAQLQQADMHNRDKIWQAFRLISDGVRLSNSIDDFLDIHRKNPQANLVGKAAIVKAILSAERQSSLYFSHSNIYNKLDMKRVEDTWLMKFMRMLGRNVPLEEIDTIFKNVSFIAFNYDRCIEHFLFQALQQVYFINEQRAAEILSQLNIIHPYGDVGNLITPLSQSGVHFGGDSHDLDNENFVELAKRIRTYTEVKDGEPKENIDIALQDSETWVFLGFAFHEQNLRLLTPGVGHDLKMIYATAYKMSRNDMDVTRVRLLQFFQENSRAAMNYRIEHGMHTDLICNDLFDYYTQSLPT